MPAFVRDEVTLHYELDGDGPPVVYISGFGAHSNDALSAVFRVVLAERFTVLAVDNRGSGQTVVPPGAKATLDDMADDIATLLDHHRLDPAHVIGISMGGCIAMTLALRHPRHVRSLIPAVTAAHSVTPSRTAFALETTRLMRDQGVPRQLINRISALHLLSEEMFQHTDFIDKWVNAPPDPFEQSRAGYELQVAALEQYDIRHRLQHIHAPTLVVSSPDDFLAPPHYQEEIAASIPGAQLKRYPGGHVFMLLPPVAGQFVQDILDFWARH